MKRILTIMGFILLSLSACIFSACGNDYSKFSLEIIEKDIFMNLGEESTLNVQIKNYYDIDAKFNFHQETQVLQIDNESSYKGNGVYSFNIKAISMGPTTLTVTLMQGNQSAVVPVNISTAMESFDIKSEDSLYVVKGSDSGLSLNSKLFDFYPDDSLLTDLTFATENDFAIIKDNVLKVAGDCIDTKIEVIATSVYNADLTCKFNVKVVSEIDLSNISLKDGTTELLPDKSVINLIVNNSQEYFKDLSLEIDKNENYSYKFVSENNSLVYNIQDSVKGYDVTIQQDSSKYLKEDVMIICVSHNGYDSYYEELKYNVVFDYDVKSISLNGSTKTKEFNVFDTDNESTDLQEFLYTLLPNEAVKESGQSVILSFTDSEGNEIELATLFKYVKFFYNNKLIEMVGSIKNLVVLGNTLQLQDLSIPLYICGQSLDGLTDVLSEINVLTTYNKDRNVTLNSIINVQKTATKFEVDEKYTNNTIYIYNGHTQIFDGFVVDEGAFIGNMTITLSNYDKSVANISQLEYNSKQIIIEAKQTGVMRYNFRINSGHETSLTIVVENEVDCSDLFFKVYSNTENVTKIDYKDIVSSSNKTIETIYVQKDSNFEIIPSLSSNLLEMSFNKSNSDISNKNLTINEFEFKVLDEDSILVVADITLSKIEDFIKSENKGAVDSTRYNFTVEIYTPISNLKIQGMNSWDTSSLYSDNTFAYDAFTIGYNDKKLSVVNIDILINNNNIFKDKNLAKILDNLSFSFSVVSNEQEPGVYYLTSAGVDVGVFRINEHGAFFECDSKTGNMSLDFITIDAIYNLYGKLFTSKIKIELKEYVRVENIWLIDPINEIYLDSANPSLTLRTISLPENATNSAFNVDFVPDGNFSSNIVSITIDENKIIVATNNNGGGTGTLKIIPRSRIVSGGESDYSLDINVVIGDGTTEQTALRISTLSQFLNINPDMHYVITNAINAKNQSIKQFGKLNGTITGLFGNHQSGSIFNLVIDNCENKTASLFSSIGENGKISYLTINATVKQTAFVSSAKVAVVAVSNYGTISNVSVNAIVENMSKSVSNVKFGGVVVENYGVIQTTYNNGLNPQTTIMANISQSGSLQFSGNFYFGGIVAINENSGRIKQQYTGNTINGFGISCVVDVVFTGSTSDSRIGGAVAENNGVATIEDNIVIDNILVTGNITAKEYWYVGGLVGYNNSADIKNNTANVFVSGSGNVGGLIGFNNQTLKTSHNNKVQAVDEGTRKSINASLVVGENNIGGFYGLDNNGTSSDENCETFFDRTYIKVETANNEEYDSNLSLNSYYGDIVRLAGNNIKEQDCFDSATAINIKIKDSIYKNNTFVAQFFESVNTNILENVSVEIKTLNTIKVPNDFFDGSDYNLKVVANTPSIASINANGDIILNKIGLASFTAFNNLNINDSIDFYIYVTNYCEGIDIYAYSNLKDGKLVSNSSTLTLFNDFESSVYAKYKTTKSINNTFVEFKQNQKAFLYVIESENTLQTKIIQNVVILSANGSGVPANANVYVVIQVGTDDYRVLSNTNEFVCLNKLEDSDIEAVSDLDAFTIKTKHKQGIHSISLSKKTLTIMPADAFVIDVTYKTQIVSDVLNIDIYNKATGEVFEVVYNDVDKKYICEAFSISTNGATEDNGLYYQSFEFRTNTNFVKSGDFRITFSGNGDNDREYIDVKILPQLVNSVTSFNYSFIANKDTLYTYENGIYTYNTSYNQVNTKSVTAGEKNIFKVLLNPDFADYSYVEIFADSGVDIWLLENVGNNSNLSVLSQNGANFGNGVRISKPYIINGVANVVYSVINTTNLDKINFNVVVYNENNQEIYAYRTSDLEIEFNQDIDVSINGLNYKEKTNEMTSYYVARANEYVLDINLVGFDLKDVVVKSKNIQAGNIVQENGVYYLQISENIGFNSNSEGFDFEVEYYAQKNMGDISFKSQTKTIKLTVVEYVVDVDLDNMFASNTIYINTGNTVDIRNEIVENIEINFSSSASNAVASLRNNIKNNAKWFYTTNNTMLTKLDSNTTHELEYFKINGFGASALKMQNDIPVKFGIYATFTYKAGVLVVESVDEDAIIEQSQIIKFDVEILQTTSAKNPAPISNYKEFIAMKDESYYRLMSDIVIPADFEPISSKVYGLDGNGYKIIFAGQYVYYNLSGFAIFKSIEKDCLIENLTIQIGSSTESISTAFKFVNTTTNANLSFALLAIKNSGVIYNCSVVMQNPTSILSVANIQSDTEDDYITSLVGVNSGYITNCQSKIRMEVSGANVSGFVGVNNGFISSCSAKEIKINHINDTINSTSGFVSENNGEIFGCYVEGKYDENGLTQIYADNDYATISSACLTSGFVYKNNSKGIISNCYTNIKLYSSKTTCGFVYINSGIVEVCYSTSVLGSRNTANYGFVVQYNQNTDSSISYIKDCYFLVDQINGINTNLNMSNNNISGLRPTSIKEFATRVGKDNEQLFGAFAVNDDNIKSNGVWFYANNEAFDSASSNFQPDVKLIEISGFSINNNDKFVTYRPQLVSANISAYWQYDLIDSEFDESTGETIYSYAIKDALYSEGSVYNPYVIKNAADMENMLQHRVDNKIGGHYRLVCDIDYSLNSTTSTKLYSSVFNGYLEGNNYTISNFTINSNKILNSAGFFAEVGTIFSFATLQNITFAPKSINLSNSYVLGCVAGNAYNVFAYNLHTDGYLNKDNVVLVGNNIVGGVFGRTIYDFELKNISSSISSNAIYNSKITNLSETEINDLILFNENNSILNASYSGCVVGYLGGIGNMDNVEVSADVASIGLVAGFAFGGIGRNASVNDLEISISKSANNFIRASYYGGLVAGDIRGAIENVTICQTAFAGDVIIVKDTTTDKDGLATEDDGEDTEGGTDIVIPVTLYDIYRVSPKNPLGFGGVAGYASGAKIKNVTTNVELDISSQNKAFNVGGIVGVGSGNLTIENVVVSSNIIEAKQSVGGIIGKFNDNLTGNTLTLNDVTVEKTNVEDDNNLVELFIQRLDTDISIDNMYYGGIIGSVWYYSPQGELGTESIDEIVTIDVDNANDIVNVNSYIKLAADIVSLEKVVTNYNVYYSNLLGYVNAVNSGLYADDCVEVYKNSANEKYIKLSDSVLFNYGDDSNPKYIEGRIDNLGTGGKFDIISNLYTTTTPSI